jgi:hypothetical protein
MPGCCANAAIEAIRKTHEHLIRTLQAILPPQPMTFVISMIDHRGNSAARNVCGRNAWLAPEYRVTIPASLNLSLKA